MALQSRLFCLFIFLCCLSPFGGHAAQAEIGNFIIKENLLKNGKLAVIVCDSTDTPIAHFNGAYDFSLNGFTETLQFHQGVAVSQNILSKSTFLFIKHDNGAKTVGKLYYISKDKDGLNPIKINGLYVLLVPLLLILLGMFFRKFLWIFIILLVIYIYLNYQNGLSIQSFLESIGQSIQEFIAGF